MASSSQEAMFCFCNNPIMNKIGIIQTATLPGDFPNNLRAIVQGYRDCINHGAELVIAPAYALGGVDPGDLKNRNTFLQQQEDAAVALSAEILSTSADVPLLIGYYSDPAEGANMADHPDADDWGMKDEMLYDAVNAERRFTREQKVQMMPCLIHDGLVRPFADNTSIPIGGSRFFVTTGVKEVSPKTQVDFVIHLSTEPWDNTMSSREKDTYSWESHTCGATIISVHSVGAAGDRIHGGGSAIYREAAPLAELPYFEAASRTIDIRKVTYREALTPSLEVQMKLALERWLLDTVHRNGYRGVCIPLDHPNASLLTAISTAALDSGNICGISFEGNTISGINCRNIQLDQAAEACLALVPEDGKRAMLARLKGTMLTTLAEDMGYMLLSPVDFHDAQLGHFTLYGESCGVIAPLGNLYRVDLYILSDLYSELHPDMFGALTEPEQSEEDRIIHEMVENNVGASDLIYQYDDFYEENQVRQIQRRIIRSALKRSQMPLTFLAVKEEARPRFPLAHRLND